jgi:polyisoprenoid-binding protein YceI
MSNHSFRASLILLVAAMACQSEIDDKPAATVAPAAPAAAPAPVEPAAPVAEAAPAGQVERAAPESSKLEWVAGKITKDHPGAFSSFTLDATVAEDQLRAVNATVDMSSVSSDAEKLTAHLLSPDFFDVAQFAQATFKSTAVEPIAGAAPGAANVTIRGAMTMHGVTKELSVPATFSKVEAGGHSLMAEFTINRQDFGVNYPGKPDDLIKDNVLIKLSAALR